MAIYLYAYQMLDTNIIPAMESLVGAVITNGGCSIEKFASIEIDPSKKNDLDEIMSNMGFKYVGEGSQVFVGSKNLGVFTSANAPTSLASAGATFYASDLNKPLWYDGANWRDAVGTIVI